MPPTRSRDPVETETLPPKCTCQSALRSPYPAGSQNALGWKWRESNPRPKSVYVFSTTSNSFALATERTPGSHIARL